MDCLMVKNRYLWTPSTLKESQVYRPLKIKERENRKEEVWDQESDLSSSSLIYQRKHNVKHKPAIISSQYVVRGYYFLDRPCPFMLLPARIC